MVINSIKLFSKKGHPVDIYVNKEHFNQSPIIFTESNISLIILDDHSFSLIFKSYRFLSKQFGDYGLCLAKRLSFNGCLLFFFPAVYRFMKQLKKQISEHAYLHIFPVEFMSLIALSFINNMNKATYFNLELLDWKKGDLIYGNNKLVLKHLEYRMIRKLSRVVTPSKYRSDKFSQINQFSKEQILNLPVAPMGDGVKTKSRFFRDMFRISDGHLIVLYSGQFISYFQCIEMIQTVIEWPENTALVMHTWNQTALKSRYFKAMKEAASGLPVFFSTTYIAYENLTHAVSSADIGLAFYEAVDSNYTEILFSSNKIGEYLKAGLGIICSDFPSVKQFIEEHDIGMAVPVHELPKAISGISERIDSVRDNVLRCYNNELRFENYFNPFYDKLQDFNT